MSVRSKSLILIILVISLALPQPAYAFLDFLTGIAESMLGGIEELSDSPSGLLVLIFLLYLLGLISLLTSTAILEWVVTQQANWLTIQNSELVQAGWNFTSGLANMLIILILIVIAFAFIFKLENFQLKRALPRLIIVALLINFSLVFIGMGVDIANIFFNTILGTSGGLVSAVFDSLVGGITGVLISLGAFIGLLAGLYIFPVTSALAQFALVIQVITVAVFLPNIIAWIFQMVLASTLSGILFLYIFLFAARVFIVQLFAILSPLAFLALILPQTRRFWNIWLKHVLHWLFLGIILLFGLMLGLGSTTAIMPEGWATVGVTPVPALGWLNIADFFIYYFFLAIFLLIIVGIGWKLTPPLTQDLLRGMTTLLKMAWGMGLKPMGRMFSKTARRTAIETKQRRAAAEAKGETLGRKWAFAETLSRPVYWGHRLAGTTPELTMEKDMEKMAEGYEKKYGKNTDEAIDLFSPKMRSREQKAAFLSYLAKIEPGSGINKFRTRKGEKAFYDGLDALSLTPKELMNVLKYNQDLIEDPRVQTSIVPKGTAKDPKTGKLLDKSVEVLTDHNIHHSHQFAADVFKTISEHKRETGKELTAEEAEKRTLIKWAAYHKAASAIQSDDLAKLTPESLKSPIAQEMILKFKPFNFIPKIGELGPEYITLIHQKFEEIVRSGGLKEIAKSNPVLLQQTIKNPGFSAMFGPPEELKNLLPQQQLDRIEAATIEGRRELESIRTDRESQESQRSRETRADQPSTTRRRGIFRRRGPGEPSRGE